MDILGQAQSDALDSLANVGRMTIAELMEHTGRSRPDISRALNRMKARGLVIDPWTKTEQTRAGARKSKQWAVTKDGRAALQRFLDKGGCPGVPLGAK